MKAFNTDAKCCSLVLKSKESRASFVAAPRTSLAAFGLCFHSNSHIKPPFHLPLLHQISVKRHFQLLNVFFAARRGQRPRCDGSAKKRCSLFQTSPTSHQPRRPQRNRRSLAERCTFSGTPVLRSSGRKCFLQPSIRLWSKSHPSNFAGPNSPPFSFHLRRFASAPCGAVAAPAHARTHAHPTHTCRGTETLAPSSPRGVIVFCERCKVFTFLHNSNHKAPPPLSPSWTSRFRALCSFLPSLYEIGLHVAEKNVTSLLSCTIPSLPPSFSSPALPYFYHYTSPLSVPLSSLYSTCILLDPLCSLLSSVCLSEFIFIQNLFALLCPFAVLFFLLL